MTERCLPPPAGPDFHENSDERPGERRGGRRSSGRPHQGDGGHQRTLRNRHRQEQQRAGVVVPGKGEKYNSLCKEEHLQIRLSLMSFSDVLLFLLSDGGPQSGGGDHRDDAEIVNVGGEGGEDSASGSGDRAPVTDQYGTNTNTLIFNSKCVNVL